MKEWSKIDANILVRAIAASVGDFLQEYEFRDTLVSGSDFDSDSDSSLSEMDLDELFDPNM
jgi:hypothetical protein